MMQRLLRPIVRSSATHQARALSSETLAQVKATLPAVAAAGPKFTDHFYKRLFGAHPELLNVFNLTNQREGRQQKALFSAIASAAVSVLETGNLPNEVLEMVHHKHCALNVQPAQYDVVGEHILGTIVDMLNPPKPVLDAWGELYQALANACIQRSEELYQESEAKSGGWRGERDFVLARKEAKSNAVMQFSFLPSDQKPLAAYYPGQYTTVWVKGDDWEYRQPRHYTLCQAADHIGYTIAVKKLPKGLVSTYLHDHLKEGDKVQLSAPYGVFHVRNANQMWVADPSVPAVLLSAGIGLTPMLSMLNAINNEARPVVWLHATEHGSEHPFREHLIGLADTPTFTRRVWYERPGPKDLRGPDNSALYHFEGRMDLGQVESLLPLANPHAMYFCCGPPPFMTHIAQQLVARGVPKTHIEMEVFGPATELFPH